MHIPETIKSKHITKLSINDLVFLTLLKAQTKNEWLKFKDIQIRIMGVYAERGFSEGYIKKNKYYATPTISAAIRAIRNKKNRIAYDLPNFGEVIDKKKLENSKAIVYKLINLGVNYGN